MSINKPAIIGGDPEFRTKLPVGQLYFPTKQEYILAMKGIFEREYYTNSGPLLVEFERKLASYFEVEEVIAVTNNTLGLIMTAEALDLKGSVILPALTFVASALSIKRCSLTPVFCDIDKKSIFPSPQELENAYRPDTSAVLGVNLWGGCAPIKETEQWAKNKKIKVYWDSAQAVGCEVKEKKIGGNGEAEVFSFHATKILSTTEGGCITTNNKDLAHKLRNIRSSYGVRKKTNVLRTTNARMSEMQAAIGIISLEHLEEYIENNLSLRTIYKMLIDSIPGIELMGETGVSKSNHQSIVILVDEERYGISRNLVVKALNAEGVLARRYFLPSLHKLSQFTGEKAINLPNTEYFQSRNIVMPLGARTSQENIFQICELLTKFRQHTEAIKRHG
ncbi:DegT/DnrJ/EryC1/StrS aminotransferase family protein [Synechococcus sp. UW179A]|uniref:DegT/DnrJ/EryC1/StrS family aminotransferase n=1 Tax=Synechococcus sp. UW179A TaxID=2575510 RepID=UPI000E0E76CA|nr:DegT/DnrJ/EryC1/StrS family aminotransferase [Synechococcus sp. UW179A]